MSICALLINEKNLTLENRCLCFMQKEFLISQNQCKKLVAGISCCWVVLNIEASAQTDYQNIKTINIT